MQGASFGLFFLALFFLFVLTLGKPDDTPREKFKVVDQYQGCDVVRYTDDSNRWHYFLDCK